MDTKYFGQCFLCQRDTTLTQAVDSKGVRVYTCRHCGGMNGAKRIEANKDIRGSVWAEYGPRETVQA